MCNSSHWLYFHNPYVQVLKMCQVRLLEMCVARHICSYQINHKYINKVHCTFFTHKNYMKTEIVLGDVRTSLEDMIDTGLTLCCVII